MRQHLRPREAVLKSETRLRPHGFRPRDAASQVSNPEGPSPEPEKNPAEEKKKSVQIAEAEVGGDWKAVGGKPNLGWSQ